MHLSLRSYKLGDNEYESKEPVILMDKDAYELYRKVDGIY